MRARRNEPVRGLDLAALLFFCALVVYIVLSFADAIDADAAFYESRIAEHQADCLAAQESEK